MWDLSSPNQDESAPLRWRHGIPTLTARKVPLFLLNVAHHPGKGRLKISLAGLLRTGLTSALCSFQGQRELLASLPSQLSTAWIHHGVWWVFPSPGTRRGTCQLERGGFKQICWPEHPPALPPHTSSGNCSAATQRRPSWNCAMTTAWPIKSTTLIATPSLFRYVLNFITPGSCTSWRSCACSRSCQEIEYWGHQRALPGFLLQ